jgi:formate hydrogenlyase subunit 3/multisubunit Na+/H+ antiporter MnhD subunit
MYAHINDLWLCRCWMVSARLFFCFPLRVIIAMKLKELERLFLRALCVIQVCLIIYSRKSHRAGRVFLFFFLEKEKN